MAGATAAGAAVTGAAALADVRWSYAVPAGPVADELGTGLR